MPESQRHVHAMAKQRKRYAPLIKALTSSIRKFTIVVYSLAINKTRFFILVQCFPDLFCNAFGINTILTSQILLVAHTDRVLIFQAHTQ